MMIFNNRNNQKGVALVFVLLIVVIMMLMAYSLFALSHTHTLIAVNQKKIIGKQISFQKAVKQTIKNIDLSYISNKSIPELETTETLPEGTSFDVTISNSMIQKSSNKRFDSFVIPENSYTMRSIEHYINVTLGNNSKDILIRVPSSTSISPDKSIDKSLIYLNIPTVNLNNLDSSKLNSENTFNNNATGYIGNLSVNNGNVIFTDTSGISKTLKLPDSFDADSFALSQGWHLNNGSWELSIGVYNSDTTKGCVIKSSLQYFLTSFTELKCIDFDEVDYGDFAKYPDINGFPICIDGDRYSNGDICHEDGILFIAIRTTAKLPFMQPGRWRAYYPDSKWIAPYTQGARYSKGSLVVYDGVLFKNNINNQRINPFYNKNWSVEGIYPWHKKVGYVSGDIVTYQDNFYQAKRTNKGQSDYPEDTRDWTKIGSTYHHKTTSEYKPYDIVFPYREDNPSQESLNCTGEYPSIDTSLYNQCIAGQTYLKDVMCYENNMLFVAQYYTQKSPFFEPNAWRLYIPRPNWVIPYSNNVMYGNKVTKIIYDSRRFVNQWWINAGENPYEDGSWKIDEGIYEWHKDIEYRTDDVVIKNGNFYRDNWDNRNRNPISNSLNTWDEWENLGSLYNDQTAEEVIKSCGVYIDNEKKVSKIILGDELFFDSSGNYLIANMANVPAEFKHYGESNPTSVNYELSGSLFDQISLLYVTDPNGWSAISNPPSQGSTFVRDWGDSNGVVFLHTARVDPGDYTLNITFEYVIDSQIYRGSKSYDIEL